MTCAHQYPTTLLFTFNSLKVRVDNINTTVIRVAAAFCLLFSPSKPRKDSSASRKELEKGWLLGWGKKRAKSVGHSAACCVDVYVVGRGGRGRLVACWLADDAGGGACEKEEGRETCC